MMGSAWYCQSHLAPAVSSTRQTKPLPMEAAPAKDLPLTFNTGLLHFLVVNIALETMLQGAPKELTASELSTPLYTSASRQHTTHPAENCSLTNHTVPEVTLPKPGELSGQY